MADRPMSPPLSIGTLLQAIQITTPRDLPDAQPQPPCPDLSPGQYCSGGWHHEGTAERRGPALHRCPGMVRGENQARVAAERERLAGPLRSSGDGFEGYDGRRFPGAAPALAAMRGFAGELVAPVVLFGNTGLGKTRLLLASHLTLLGRGGRSEYIGARELADLFQDAESFDEDIHGAARRRLDRLRKAAALHLDDLAGERPRAHAAARFADGLKDLLDTMVGLHAVAINGTPAEAAAHLDLGQKVVSRLAQGAQVVRMQGDDQRLPRAAGGKR